MTNVTDDIQKLSELSKTNNIDLSAVLAAIEEVRRKEYRREMEGEFRTNEAQMIELALLKQRKEFFSSVAKWTGAVVAIVGCIVWVVNGQRDSQEALRLASSYDGRITSVETKVQSLQLSDIETRTNLKNIQTGISELNSKFDKYLAEQSAKSGR